MKPFDDDELAWLEPNDHFFLLFFSFLFVRLKQQERKLMLLEYTSQLSRFDARCHFSLSKRLRLGVSPASGADHMRSRRNLDVAVSYGLLIRVVAPRPHEIDAHSEIDEGLDQWHVLLL